MPQDKMPQPIRTGPTLHDAVTVVAQQWPERLAVVGPNDSLTFRQLLQASTQLADRIRSEAHGMAPVVLVMPRSPELIISMLATLLTGRAYTAIDPSWSVALQQRIIDDLEPSLVLGNPPPGSLTPSSSAAGSTAAWPQDLACIFFTSGTSGTPKGVLSTHQATLRLFSADPVLDVGPGRVMAVAAAVSWDAFSLEVWSMLTTGGTCVVVDDAVVTAGRLRQLVADSGLTSLWITASVFNVLVDADVEAFTGLRQVLTGGERLSVKHVERFLKAQPDIQLINGYGPVEATVFVTTHTISRADVDRPGGIPIGRAVPGTDLFVVDEHGAEVPDGVSGELLIGGDGVGPGYLNSEVLNQQKFVLHTTTSGETVRVYRTGDMVVRTAGLFEFRGRADREVKVRGVRIDLDELESLAGKIAGVSAACVVPVMSVSQLSVDRLRLFVSGSLSADAVRKHLSEALPPGAVPSSIESLEQLPLLANGKLDRRALAERQEVSRVQVERDASSSTAGTTAGGSAVTATELKMLSIWGEITDHPAVTLSSDYYADLGGDSLRAIELLSAVQHQWGISLPLGALASAPTVRQFAALVDSSSGRTSAFDPLVGLRTTGSMPPLFCVHGGSGNVASFPKLLRQLPVEQPFYALQWDGLDGSRGTSGIANMAALYVKRLTAEYPLGPLRLAGQCVGGLIALEMVHQLRAAGRDVELLIMFDSPNLTSNQFTDGRSKQLAYILVKMPLGERVRRFKRFAPRWIGYARGSVPRTFIGDHAINTMIRSVRRYKPILSPVFTLFFASGETVANKIGLAGNWSDTAFGWEQLRSDRFVIHHVQGGHDDLLYSPDTVAIIKAHLPNALPNPVAKP
jgi:amino acid adenylation domain-containing protein